MLFCLITLGLSSYLEHLLISVCEGVTGQKVGVALPVRLPGDSGLSLGFLWHSCPVRKRGSNGESELHNRQSTALCIREGNKDQGLKDLLAGRLGVASIVKLCVLHMLALTPNYFLVGSRKLDSVVYVSFRHIQLVNSPGAIWWGRKQDVVL